MSAKQPNPSDAPRPRLAIDDQPAAESRELVLVKHGQRYVFRCAPGEEATLLTQLGDLVRDPDTDLNWFDAAVLSHQVGQALGRQIDQMRKKA